MEAAVYLRQSVDRFGDQLAIARQREDCVAICQRRGWTPHEYVDNDRSATTGRRPAYEHMCDDIRQGRIGAVVVWDLDRLHRRPAELERFIDLADAARIELASVGGDADLSTDNGRLFARIKGAVARAEVERKSARLKRAARQRAEAGVWRGPRPFGYAEGGTPVAVEATALREAYADVLAGVTFGAIARRWNAAAILTPRHYEWSATTVRNALLCPRNAGLRSYRGEILGKARWPAIVPEDVWHAVHDVIAKPRGPVRLAGRRYLLSGIARCGKCGHVVTTGKSHTGVAYRCKRCFGVQRLQREVDNWVTWRVACALAQPDAWQALAESDPTEAARLRAHRQALRARLVELATMFADDALTADQTRAATERVRRRLSKVESQLYGPGADRCFGPVIDAPDPRAAFFALPLVSQRALVDAMVTVTIMPTGSGANKKVFDPLMVEILPRTAFVLRPAPALPPATVEGDGSWRAAAPPAAGHLTG